VIASRALADVREPDTLSPEEHARA